MRSFHTIRAAFSLFFGALLLSFCTQPEPPDDFDKLKVFESELLQLCRNHPEMCCHPTLSARVVSSRVVSIDIDGHCVGGQRLNRLPKSIYQFTHLRKISFLNTDFDQMPDLSPLNSLQEIAIAYNIFKGPVHLKNLPSSLKSLILSRDEITEVIVDDSLPNLSSIYLQQNALSGPLKGINKTFCKLPALTYLDISSGCCTPLTEQIAVEDAIKEILCRDDVSVINRGHFID